MTTNIISNTSENLKNEWRTPPEIFAWASRLIGVFDYDTACTKQNALAMRITDGHDALIVPWSGVLWCNPPYDHISPWVEKALNSDAITAMLIPSPNGEDRYGDLFRRSHEISVIGRLAFLAGGDFVIPGKPAKNGKNAMPDKYIKEGEPVSGNTRGSSLFIINGYGQGSRSVITRDEIWRMYGSAS